MIRIILFSLVLAQSATATETVGFHCIKDNRDRDGIKREFILQKNDKGSFDLTYTENYMGYDSATQTESEVNETQKLITEGDCRLDAKEFVAYCRKENDKKKVVGAIAVKMVTGRYFDYDLNTAANSKKKAAVMGWYRNSESSASSFNQDFRLEEDCSVLTAE